MENRKKLLLSQPKAPQTR